MGIKNLTKLLKTRFPSVYEKQTLSTWENKKIAIDASIYIYKFKSCAIKDASYLHSFKFNKDNGWDEPSEELIKKCYKKRFENFLSILSTYNISSVFVFDGKAPEEKKETRKKRKEKVSSMFEQKDKYKKDFKTLTEYKNYLPLCVYVKQDDFKILEDILVEKNIPKITAKGEAEHLASYLCKKLEVDAVVTSDTDVLAYGCPIVWVNLVQHLGVWIVEIIQFDKILKELSLTEKQFLSLCIMCGTDFNSNIKNYGPIRCLKLVKEYDNFEKIKEIHPVFNGLTFENTYKIMTQEPQII